MRKDMQAGRVFLGVLIWFVVSSVRKGLIDNCGLYSHLVKRISPDEAVTASIICSWRKRCFFRQKMRKRGQKMVKKVLLGATNSTL